MVMPLNRLLSGEFRHEVDGTLKLVSLLPVERMAWRPHERSMSLGRLGSHLAEIARYGSLVLDTQRLDSEVRTRGPLDLEHPEDIVEALRVESERYLAVLSSTDDAHLLAHWQYCKGDQVILDLPRIHALRKFVVHHLIHHRGQLTVYLRLLEVPLPQIYGPTADDRQGY